MKKSLAFIIVVLAIILPYFGLWLMHNYYTGELSNYDRASFIIADKQTMTLKVYGKDGECKAKFDMACGKAFGNKLEKGDNRTPEAYFPHIRHSK